MLCRCDKMVGTMSREERARERQEAGKPGATPIPHPIALESEAEVGGERQLVHRPEEQTVGIKG